ncbi:hypothetical protein GALMADRAFT_80531, partial [Galerina marginata CBS 339.88]
PFDRLLEAASPAGFHNSNDRRDPPKCHPQTRVAVLEKIMSWIHGLDPETRDTLIMWLYGPAGSGKSAIAQSIAELCHEEQILVASYFFARADSTRNHARSLVATIAYQALLCFPGIRDNVIASIDHDPLIFSRSLDAQLLALVIQPLRERVESGYFDNAAATRVVVIDGLDECDDREAQLEILTAISRALQIHQLPLIFLVSSRPEHDIRTTFGIGYLSDISTRLPLDDEYLPSEDIRLFLQDKFTEIKDTHAFRAHIPPAWPSDDVLEDLVSKSSGQFIYASTVIKFITSSRHRPHQRLDIVLGLRSARLEMPFAELDALYRYILSSVEDPESVIRVLALHFLSRVPSVSLIESVLSLDAGDISEVLCDLTSLVSVEVIGYVEEDQEQTMYVYHASLQDFLLDRSRSGRFYINGPVFRAELAHLIFQYLKSKCFFGVLN